MIKKPRQVQKYNPELEVLQRFKNFWPYFWPLGVHYRACFQVLRGGNFKPNFAKKNDPDKVTGSLPDGKKTRECSKNAVWIFCGEPCCLTQLSKSYKTCFRRNKLERRSPSRSKRPDLPKFQRVFIKNLLNKNLYLNSASFSILSIERGLLTSGEIYRIHVLRCLIIKEGWSIFANIRKERENLPWL